MHTDSASAKPELIFMDQIEEVSPDFVPFKNEQCIQVRFREGRVILTNSVNSMFFPLFFIGIVYFLIVGMVFFEKN